MTKATAKHIVEQQLAKTLELAARPHGITIDELADVLGVVRTTAGWRVLCLKRENKLFKFTAPGDHGGVYYFTDKLAGFKWFTDAQRKLWNADRIIAEASIPDGVTVPELHALLGVPEYRLFHHLRAMMAQEMIYRVDIIHGNVRRPRFFATDELAQAWIKDNPGAVEVEGEAAPSMENGDPPRVANIVGPREKLCPIDTPLAIGRVPRVGETDHEDFPSRRGNKLYYRDGRVEVVS